MNTHEKLIQDQEKLTLLYKRGLLPDRYYYQLIDKPVSLKLQEQHERMLDEYINRKQIEKDLHNQLEDILSDVLKDLKF